MPCLSGLVDATNAIKHAFPDGTGLVFLSARRIGDQIELDVADDGVDMKAKELANASSGGAYVATFVRQLRGALAVLESEASGTTVRIRPPRLRVRMHPRAFSAQSRS
jgi:two-component sensor histidine kinase